MRELHVVLFDANPFPEANLDFKTLFLRAQRLCFQPASVQSCLVLDSYVWEYKIVGSLHTVDQINKLGEEGWEAITLNAPVFASVVTFGNLAS